MDQSIQHVAMLAQASPEVWGPMGGPVTPLGLVAPVVTMQGIDADEAAAAVRVVSDGTDAQGPAGLAALLSAARVQFFNRSAGVWDRASAADATTQGDTTSKTGIQVTAKASEWTAVGEPAAAAQATATRAAGGAGVVHVCTGLTLCLAAGATAGGPIKVRLLDGAATLWVGALSAPAQGTGVIALDGLALVGTANTAMTLRFDAAGPAGSQETVTLHGYSTQ